MADNRRGNSSKKDPVPSSTSEKQPVKRGLTQEQKDEFLQRSFIEYAESYTRRSALADQTQTLFIWGGAAFCFAVVALGMAMANFIALIPVLPMFATGILGVLWMGISVAVYLRWGLWLAIPIAILTIGTAGWNLGFILFYGLSAMFCALDYVSNCSATYSEFQIIASVAVDIFAGLLMFIGIPLITQTASTAKAEIDDGVTYRRRAYRISSYKTAT